MSNNKEVKTIYTSKGVEFLVNVFEEFLKLDENKQYELLNDRNSVIWKTLKYAFYTQAYNSVLFSYIDKIIKQNNKITKKIFDFIDLLHMYTALLPNNNFSYFPHIPPEELNQRYKEKYGITLEEDMKKRNMYRLYFPHTEQLENLLTELARRDKEVEPYIKHNRELAERVEKILIEDAKKYDVDLK